MALVRKQRRLDGKKQNYYLDTVTRDEVLSKSRGTQPDKRVLKGYEHLGAAEYRKLYNQVFNSVKQRTRRTGRRTASEFDALVLSEVYTLARLRTVETGIPWEVDHLIPIKAVGVVGLHCAANLQVIPRRMNRDKKNSLKYSVPLEWVRAKE